MIHIIENFSGGISVVEENDKTKKTESNTENDKKIPENEMNQESNLGAVVKKSIEDVTEAVKKAGKEKGTDIKKDIENVAEAIKNTNKSADIKTNIENVAKTVKKTGILEKMWVMWMTLLVFPPAGIYLLWKKKPYPLKTNLLISAISGIWLIYLMGGMTSSDIDVSEYFPDRNMVKLINTYNKNNGKLDFEMIEVITAEKNATKADFKRKTALSDVIAGYYTLSNREIIQHDVTYNKKNKVLHHKVNENFSADNDTKQYMLKERVTINTPAGKFPNCVVVEFKFRDVFTAYSFYAPKVGLVYSEIAYKGKAFTKFEELVDIRY